MRVVAVAFALACAALGADAEVLLPATPLEEVVTIASSEASRWRQGAYDVWRLAGDVRLDQGGASWRGHEAIVWVDQPTSFDRPTKLIVFLEGARGRPVQINVGARAGEGGALGRQEAPSWFGRLHTTGGIDWQTPPPTTAGVDKPAVFTRALARFAEEDPTGGEFVQRPEPARRDDEVEPAQFPAVSPGRLPTPFETTVAPPSTLGAGGPRFRTIELFPRQGTGLQGEYLTTPAGESVGVLTGGLTLVVTGLTAEGVPLNAGIAGVAPDGSIERLDLEADRAVIWTAGASLGAGAFQQSAETPLEIYLEGNIVFRQGDRTIFAERLFYDVRRKTGVILDAELLTPPPESSTLDPRGVIRLKAAALRQLDDSRFVASDAVLTTSRLEEPSYSLRAQTITFEDQQRPQIDPSTGEQRVDPFTGEPRFDHDQLATSEANRLFVGPVPVLYWPTIATDLTEPSFYLEDFQIRNDEIFGTQVLTEWDVYQLFGVDAPAGTEWSVTLDYLSERGLGYGTNYLYDVDRFSGFEGPAIGDLDLWFLDDEGTDTLGFGLTNLVPEEDFRGRAFWSHRQRVTGGLLAGWIGDVQVGWLSDRTFQEQFYEPDWDERRDQATGFRFRRLFDNQSLLIESNVQVNDFFTETQWLPRLDHYVMGQDLVGQRATWMAHTTLGYADLNPATRPSNATLDGLFNPFEWEANVEGERFATRHEIDVPLEVPVFGAPVKVVPFFLGEIAHWGEDLTGNDLQRAYLHTGARASAPFWAVNPNVRDPLFNLNGLAHKVVFDAEVSFADSNRNFEELPLYDEIEDNALEEIRRRVFSPFAGVLPRAVDPRFYLVRTGIQGFVASPTTEIVDDLSVARVGMRHRLQTKRGAPGQERIIDWLTFDANASLFASPSDQNLGENVGLVDYDARWHVGDRFTILSDGFVDLFTDGLQTFAIGLDANRPERGNAYIGFRTVRGPFSSDVILGRLNYRFGPKWLGSVSAAVDFRDTGNIGQSASISRIGESLIVTVGANVDESKDNIGFTFLVEPRFLPRTNITRNTGIDIPPPGAFGLE